MSRKILNVVVMILILIGSAAAITGPAISTDLHWVIFINIYILGLATASSFYELRNSFKKNIPAVDPNNPAIQKRRTFAMVTMTIALAVILAVMFL